MAEADRHDPSDAHDDLDLRSFYRDTPDPERPEGGRSTARVNIKDFYRSDDSPQSRTAPPDAIPSVPNNLYTAPQWHPSQAAAAAAPPVPASSAEQAASPVHAENAAGAQPPAIEETGDLPEETLEDPYADYLPEEPKRNPIARFATIGALLGIVFGAAIIGIAWLTGKPEGPYDLGNSTLNEVGLKGHLFTKWDENQLQYRVSFAPSDPDLRNAFALAVDNPPHPLSIVIQLKDAMGFVLCSKEILVKYDPAAALVAAQTDKSDGPVIDLAQSAAQVKQREQGKDVFEGQNGSDGQVASLSAQGLIPCSETSYRKVVAWGFTPDFPSLLEQSQLIKEEGEKKAEAERQEAARKRNAGKRPDRTLTFSVEGDEVLVGYDVPTGALETNSAIEFLVEKQATGIALASWQSFPIHVHYRCDQTSLCTLTRTGGATLQAKLRR